jgi:hypothetical protein
MSSERCGRPAESQSGVTGSMIRWPRTLSIRESPSRRNGSIVAAVSQGLISYVPVASSWSEQVITGSPISTRSLFRELSFAWIAGVDCCCGVVGTRSINSSTSSRTLEVDVPLKSLTSSGISLRVFNVQVKAWFVTKACLRLGASVLTRNKDCIKVIMQQEAACSHVRTERCTWLLFLTHSISVDEFCMCLHHFGLRIYLDLCLIYNSSLSTLLIGYADP